VLTGPEFAFALECCRWNFPSAAMPPVRPPEGLDWERFVRLVQFHRIEGLVWKCLAADKAGQPEDAVRALSGRATSIAANNLQAAAESAALLKAFELAGIPLLFVKGLTLAALAYGTLSTKAGVDIDLLVDWDDLPQATALLRERGYRLVQPGEPVTAEQLKTWHRRRKESAWVRSDPPLQVDLHSRLADNPRLIPSIGTKSPRQSVEVAPRISLPTLAPEELFAYLAVHGASSAWFRLKWIADFAALVSQAGPEEIEHLYRRSQELGAGRAPAWALILADGLFETLRDVPDLKRRLEADNTNRRLVEIAFRLLAREDPIEPTSVRFGTAPIHYTQLLLKPDAGFKLSEAWRQARYLLP
jgi:hypothetical protein